MSKIDEVISKIKTLSNGDVTNVIPPTDALINDYEKEIGYQFSDDYKKILKELSNVFYGTIDLLSVTQEKLFSTELSSVIKEAHKQGVPIDWLPISEDNGNYYCLLKDGSVRYWSHDGVSDEKWPNLATWIECVWINQE